MIFRRTGAKVATDFEPSTDVFPSIAVASLAKQLKLEKHGRQDGKKEFPSEAATGLSRTEQEVVSEVARLRKKGIDAFDRQFNAYQGRIDAGRSAVEAIEERAGKLRNEMIATGNAEKNIVTNALRSVYEHEEKLQDFRRRHGIVGPPRPVQPILIVALFIFLSFIVEVVLGALFFSERSPSGLMGGAGTAVMIALINVLFGILLGLGSRYRNLSGVWNWLAGTFCLLAFPVGAIAFNFLVAHYRKALDELPWDDAAGAAWASMFAAPFDLGNFNSIMIALFGFLVAVVAFIKVIAWKDPRPGYNALYDEARRAIDNYAEDYDDTKKTLDELYDHSSADLKNEAHKLRGAVRGSAAACVAQATLCTNLDGFLDECNQTVNALLRVYREENEKSRGTAAPAYFGEAHAFPPHQRPEPANPASAGASEDIDRIDAAAKQGVRDILAARESQLDALPTTEDLLQNLQSGAGPASMRLVTNDTHDMAEAQS